MRVSMSWYGIILYLGYSDANLYSFIVFSEAEKIYFPVWFSATLLAPINIDKEGYFPIQDIPHLLNKFRNNFTYREGIKIGKYEIKKEYLEQLVNTREKNILKLTLEVINPKNKQNVDNTFIICSKDVIELLEQFDESKGLVVYVQMMRYIFLAFCDNTLSIAQQIRYAWIPVFILRAWRKSIGNIANHQ